MKKLLVLLLVLCLASLAQAEIVYQNDFGTVDQVTVGGTGDWDRATPCGNIDGEMLGGPGLRMGVVGYYGDSMSSDLDGDGLNGWFFQGVGPDQATVPEGGASVLGGQISWEKKITAPAGTTFQNVKVYVEGNSSTTNFTTEVYAMLHSIQPTSQADPRVGHESEFFAVDNGLNLWQRRNDPPWQAPATHPDAPDYLAAQPWPATGSLATPGHGKMLHTTFDKGSESANEALQNNYDITLPSIDASGDPRYDGSTEFYLTIVVHTDWQYAGAGAWDWQKAMLTYVKVEADIIPEPATMILLSLGGLLIRRKK